MSMETSQFLAVSIWVTITVKIMSNSESQNRKGKGGRKPKFDYTSEDFLSLVESYAKKGFTDKEIAYAIGILPQTFCEKKSGKSKKATFLCLSGVCCLCNTC